MACTSLRIQWTLQVALVVKRGHNTTGRCICGRSLQNTNTFRPGFAYTIRFYRSGRSCERESTGTGRWKHWPLERGKRQQAPVTTSCIAPILRDPVRLHQRYARTSLNSASCVHACICDMLTRQPDSGLAVSCTLRMPQTRVQQRHTLYTHCNSCTHLANFV